MMAEHDPLSKVPGYMRRPPNEGSVDIYQFLIDRLKQGTERSEKAMIDFFKEEGAFFYSLDEVLSDDWVIHLSLADITEKQGKPRTDWAEAFKRDKAPDYTVQTGQSADKVVQEFKITEAGMKTDASIASLNSTSQSSDAKKSIWPVDILGMDPLGIEVAHLLPDAPAHAIEWYDVACWAMGCDPSTIEWAQVFRLLHGTKPGNKRVHGAGLRHFVANKVRINRGAYLLDKDNPQMLILPILSREQCLKWSGGVYDAIILMGTNKDKKGYYAAVKGVGMTDRECQAGHASKKELELALDLMREMTYALVQSLMHCKPPQVPPNASNTEKKEMEEAIEIRNKRIKAFTDLMGSKTVQVPKQKGCFPIDEQPFRGVCKISFSNDKAKNLHGPPDPLLLVARAAVVLSVRNNCRLRDCGLPEDDYDWEFDAMQFEIIQQNLRRRNLDETTDGMEIIVPNQSEDSDVSSAMSMDSHSYDDETKSPQREYNANSVPRNIVEDVS